MEGSPEEFPTEHSWWPAPTQTSSAVVEKNESRGRVTPDASSEFPEELNWWPKNENSNWNAPWLPKPSTTQSAHVSFNSPDEAPSKEKPKRSSNRRKVDKEVKNLEIMLSRRIVIRNDPSSLFQSLRLGKQVIEKSFVVPRRSDRVSYKIYVDCHPKQLDMSTVDKLENMMTTDKKTNKRESEIEKNVTDDESDREETWNFHKRTVRIVSPLPPTKFQTYSFEVTYEHTFYIPEDAPPVEIFLGTVKDPRFVNTKL